MSAGRGPASAFLAEDGCYCELLRQALDSRTITTITALAGPDGKQYPIADQEGARKAKNRAYTCGSIAGVSLVMKDDGLGLVQLGDSKWGFRFRPEYPDVAKAHIDDKISRGEELDYRHAKSAKPREIRSQSKRAVEAQQTALRRAAKLAMQAAAGGEPFNLAAIDDLPAAVVGFCEGCGKRLDQHATASGQRLCVGCETNLETVKLRTAEAEAESRRAKERRRAAEKRDAQREGNSALDQARDMIAKWKR